MDFWQAYQGMKRGEWHQRVDINYPYRYANDEWQAVVSKASGQGRWNAQYKRDDFDYVSVIEAVEEYMGEQEFFFDLDDLDAQWEAVSINHPMASEVKSIHSAEYLAHKEAERKEREEYWRLHPPLVVDLTKEALFADRTGGVLDAARSMASDAFEKANLKALFSA